MASVHEVTIDRDEEIQLEPYLVVRFGWKVDEKRISGMTFTTMVNDGGLSPQEIASKVQAWLRDEWTEELENDVFLEGQNAIQLNLADQVLAERKER